MLIRSDAIRAEKHRSGARCLVFKCKGRECGAELVVQDSPFLLKKRTGYCNTCRQSDGKPFFCPYNQLVAGAKARGIKLEFSYNQFLNFTKIKACYYCEGLIPWQAHGRNSYFLDRKDNALGYTRSNTVVCCSLCNWIKGRELSHDEMLILKPGLKIIS